jgi:hypothetical protein
VIDLDRVSSTIVLDNLRSALRIDWRGLVAELRRIGPCTLGEFLDETGMGLDDIYRRRRGGWTGMRREAELEFRPAGADDEALAGALGRLLHVDDPERLAGYAALLRTTDPELLDERGRRLALMLHFALWGANAPAGEWAGSLRRAAAEAPRCDELSELLAVLARHRTRVVHPLDPAGRVPLHVHGHYSRDEALAAFGVTNPGTVRQGVKWVEAERADLFFVTLRKTERHYSPTTMYQDRAISPSLFQWESQSMTTTASPTGQRYVNHVAQGSTVHLFVRETKEADGHLGAPAYLYAGPMTYVSHTGDRPMRILWKLEHELPADVFHGARVAVG